MLLSSQPLLKGRNVSSVSSGILSSFSSSEFYELVLLSVLCCSVVCGVVGPIYELLWITCTNQNTPQFQYPPTCTFECALLVTILYSVYTSSTINTLPYSLHSVCTCRVSTQFVWFEMCFQYSICLVSTNAV